MVYHRVEKLLLCKVKNIIISILNNFINDQNSQYKLTVSEYAQIVSEKCLQNLKFTSACETKFSSFLWTHCHIHIEALVVKTKSLGLKYSFNNRYICGKLFKNEAPNKVFYWVTRLLWREKFRERNKKLKDFMAAIPMVHLLRADELMDEFFFLTPSNSKIGVLYGYLYTLPSNWFLRVENRAWLEVLVACAKYHTLLNRKHSFLLRYLWISVAFLCSFG